MGDVSAVNDEKPLEQKRIESTGDEEPRNSTEDVWDDEFLKQFEVTMKLTEETTTSTTVTTKANSKDDKEKKPGFFSRMATKVKSKLFSTEMEGALNETMDLLQELVKDLKFRPVDISIALAWMTVYNKNTEIKTGTYVTDADTMRTLLHFMQFASAAYGWKLINGYAFKNKTQGLIDGLKMNDAANVKCLVDHTGIKESDIIQQVWTTAGIYSPGHYVALDHSTKSIVVAIRGTFHLRDAVTDLAARYVPYKDGQVHYGMLNSANAKKAEILPVITELSKVTIVGHSLGAGTAALLALLLYEDHEIPVRCFAFAPPCVMSSDLADRCKTFITSVVLNDDIVPRLSFGSLQDIKFTLQHLLDQKDGNIERVFHIFSAGNSLGESATKRMASFLKCSEKPTIVERTGEKADRLYPPGHIYYLYASQRGTSRYDVAEEVKPSIFGNLVMSYAMYVNHMPDCYEESLKRVISRIEKVAATTSVTTTTTVTKEVEIAQNPDHTKQLEVTKTTITKTEHIEDNRAMKDEISSSSVTTQKVVKVPPKLPEKKGGIFGGQKV